MSSYESGELSQNSTDKAWKQIKDVGAEWTSIVVTKYMDNISSLDIKPSSQTSSDADIRNGIRDAKRLGLKVMLKPQLDLSNDAGHWRGQIGSEFGSNADKWNSWFDEYREFIVHYAEIAEAENVEQFAVGSELLGTSNREGDWRKIIKEVRKVYRGKLLYAANHSGEEMQIKFWDDLDYIGIDAYYKLTNKVDPTLAELKAGWNEPIESMRKLSERWGKRVIITAVGYRSIDGAGRDPWNYSRNGDTDLQEQKMLYQAMFEKLYNQNWLRGIFIWRWDADSNSGGPNDNGYTPYRKPAETILKQWFSGGNLNNIQDEYEDMDYYYDPNREDEENNDRNSY